MAFIRRKGIGPDGVLYYKTIDILIAKSFEDTLTNPLNLGVEGSGRVIKVVEGTWKIPMSTNESQFLLVGHGVSIPSALSTQYLPCTRMLPLNRPQA